MNPKHDRYAKLEYVEARESREEAIALVGKLNARMEAMSGRVVEQNRVNELIRMTSANLQLQMEEDRQRMADGHTKEINSLVKKLNAERKHVKFLQREKHRVETRHKTEMERYDVEMRRMQHMLEDVHERELDLVKQALDRERAHENNLRKTWRERQAKQIKEETIIALEPDLQRLLAEGDRIKAELRQEKEEALMEQKRRIYAEHGRRLTDQRQELLQQFEQQLKRQMQEMQSKLYLQQEFYEGQLNQMQMMLNRVEGTEGEDDRASTGTQTTRRSSGRSAKSRSSDVEGRQKTKPTYISQLREIIEDDDE